MVKQKQLLGPGTYNINDFIDQMAKKPGSTRGVCETREARFDTTKTVWNLMIHSIKTSIYSVINVKSQNFIKKDQKPYRINHVFLPRGSCSHWDWWSSFFGLAICLFLLSAISLKMQLTCPQYCRCLVFAVGGAVASCIWLVRSTPDWAVRV